MKMIESTAYFESYHHVLKKLHAMSQWEKLPFSEYLTCQKIGNVSSPIHFNKMI